MWWCGILSRYHIGIIAVASCALLAVLAISASRISYANAYVQSFNSTRAYQYIDRNYDATHGLVRENMDVEKYWLWTDNILAAQVLKDYDAAKSENITRTIDYYADLYHLHFRHPIGTLLDREVSFDTITNWNIVDNIWISDPDGERELQCASYGDIAFYKSIYYFKAGKINDAKTCYDKGSSMFDGIGIRDKAFDVDGGIYSTYKMALWKIASNITGFGEAKDALPTISRMQNSTTGGVYTHYWATMVPAGETNIETTCLSIFAFRAILPLGSAGPAERVPEISSSFAWTMVAGCSIAIIILLNRLLTTK